MTNTMFSGPLAQELTDFLEWRGGAGHGSRSILRQLQTFDRFTPGNSFVIPAHR
jgi:hypothetical protein